MALFVNRRGSSYGSIDVNRPREPSSSTVAVDRAGEPILKGDDRPAHRTRQDVPPKDRAWTRGACRVQTRGRLGMRCPGPTTALHGVALEGGPGPNGVIQEVGVAADTDEQAEITAFANINVQGLRWARARQHTTLKQPFAVGPHFELSRTLTFHVVVDADVRSEARPWTPSPFS